MKETVDNSKLIEKCKLISRDLWGRPLGQGSSEVEVPAKVSKLMKLCKSVDIRTKFQNEELWFVLKDVCEYLMVKDHKELKSKLGGTGVKLEGFEHPSNPNNLVPTTVINVKQLPKLLSIIKTSRLKRKLGVVDVEDFESWFKDFSEEQPTSSTSTRLEIDEPRVSVTMAISTGGGDSPEISAPTISLVENPKFGRLEWFELNEDIYFNALQCAEALGYSDRRKSISQHCEDSIQLPVPINSVVQNTTFIPESDLYNLILASRLPSAKEYKRWVTKEVLPSIRKTGSYSVASKIPTTYLEALKQCVELEERRLQLEAEKQVLLVENSQLTTEVVEARPKVFFTDAVTASNTDIDMTELTRYIIQGGRRTGRQRLYNWMYFKKILFCKQGHPDHGLPYQAWMDKGFFKIDYGKPIETSSGRTIHTRTLKITPKGQVYFINLLCNSDHLTEEELEILEGAAYKAKKEGGKKC